MSIVDLAFRTPPRDCRHRDTLHLFLARWGLGFISTWVASGVFIFAMMAVPVRAQQPQALFALEFRNQVGVELLELDAQTGSAVRVIPYGDSFVTELALTFAQDRVLVLGQFGIGTADRLIRVHPGDGASKHLQLVPSPWQLKAIDYSPATGEILGICINYSVLGWFCCRLDPFTGTSIFGPQISGLNGITAMAVDQNGVAYVTTTPAATLYRLDMTTGAATLLGSLGIPTCVAWDLAFDSSGQLWASLHDALTGADTGLYTVDPVTYQATRVISVTDEYYGIAFGPKTLATSFCSAKLSSLGCTPALHADGFASPTARLGFTITASDLNNNRVGMLLYSANGRAAIPFQGGLLCVQPPLHRSSTGNTGGNALPTLDCSGSWSIDYNEMIWNKYLNPAVDRFPNPLQTPGTTVQCQWWGRDPGFSAPNNSMLSDGLEFVLSP